MAVVPTFQAEGAVLEAVTFAGGGGVFGVAEGVAAVAGVGGGDGRFERGGFWLRRF